MNRTVKFSTRNTKGYAAYRKMQADVLSVEDDYSQALTSVEIFTTSRRAEVELMIHNCTEEEWNNIDADITYGDNSAWKTIIAGNCTITVFCPNSLRVNATYDIKPAAV